MKNLLYASISISFLSLSVFGCLYLNTLRTTLESQNENINDIKLQAVDLMSSAEELLENNISAQEDALEGLSATGKLIKNISIYSLAIGLESGGHLTATEAEAYRMEALEKLKEIHPIYFELLSAINNSY